MEAGAKFVYDTKRCRSWCAMRHPNIQPWLHCSSYGGCLSLAEVRVEECTAEARTILNGTTLETLLTPSLWQQLAFFALVKPSRDMLPVRSLYSRTDHTNIGVNPLTSKEPIWYAGHHLAASKLKTRHVPQIIRAFRLVPHGLQEGMNTTSLGKREFDPAKDDFFRAIIEERKTLSKKHPHYLLLKIIANSLYGILGELNKYEYRKNRAKRLLIFSGENKREQSRCTVERPGDWQFLPAAALITAGGRLMLAIMEHMVERRGGTYLLTDTDSIYLVASQNGGSISCPGGPSKLGDGASANKAITWKQVDQIRAKLNSLNPCNRNLVKEILRPNMPPHSQAIVIGGAVFGGIKKRFLARLLPSYIHNGPQKTQGAASRHR